MINESALCKLITSYNVRNIVNLREDGFQYCNGFIAAECGFEHRKVLAKLFKIGALRGKLEPEQSYDLTEALEAENEVPAIKTDYLRQCEDRLACVFKIGDSYYLYNKTFIDVFENVTYKANRMDTQGVMLRAYEGDKLVGTVLNMRIKSKTTLTAEMQELEMQIKKAACKSSK